MPSEESNSAPLEATLSNGLRVIYEPMPWLPTLSAALLLPLGSATDPSGELGSATVMHGWVQRGAGGLDSRQLTGAFEDLGVQRGGGAGRETATLTASFLAADAKDALPLLASMVREPQLDENEFEPSRELALEELRGIDDSPARRLFNELSARFLAGPHGRSPYGNEGELNGLTADSVRADARERLGPEGAFLALAGGGSWEELREVVQGSFAQWQGGSRPLPTPGAQAPARHHVQADTQQVQVGLAYPSALPGTDEGYLYALAMSVLSGSMGARLFTEIREKRGLVYSVSAATRALRGFGYTLGYAGTTPERAAETLEVFLAELKRLAEGVTAAELERARTGTLASLVMRGESSGATASRLASDAFFLGRPRTLSEIRRRVQGATLEQVNGYLAANPVPEPTVVTLGQLNDGALGHGGSL